MASEYGGSAIFRGVYRLRPNLALSPDMLRDDASLYEYLAPKEDASPPPSTTAKRVATLFAILVAGALSVLLLLTPGDIRPHSAAFADGMAWHGIKTAFASVSLAAAPAPPHFAYCSGLDCYSDPEVQKMTWAWAPTCGSGRYQTPIDIRTSDVATAPALNGGLSIHIGDSLLTPLNTGHNFQLTNTAPGPHAMLRGQRFHFAQVPLHSSTSHLPP